MTADELPQKIILAKTKNTGYWKPSVDARENAIANMLDEFERLWNLGYYVEANAVLYRLKTDLRGENE